MSPDRRHGEIFNEETLEFRKADAEAMGQLLLIKRDQSELDWQQELSEALQKAEARCLEHRARAPWGCQWFEKWRRNLERAVQLKQELHVFYFEGRTGQGKISWHELCRDEVRERVCSQSGLGASQTAEVAYLDMMGLDYVELDINHFRASISEKRANIIPRLCPHTFRTM